MLWLRVGRREGKREGDARRRKFFVDDVNRCIAITQPSRGRKGGQKTKEKFTQCKFTALSRKELGKAGGERGNLCPAPCGIPEVCCRQ